MEDTNNNKTLAQRAEHTLELILEVGRSLATIRKEWAALQEEFKNLDTGPDVEEVQTMINTAVNQVQEEIKAVDNRAASKSSVENLERTQINMGNAVSGLQGTVPAIEKDVESLKASVPGIQNEVSTIAEDVKSLGTTQTNQAGTILNLRGKVLPMEQDVGNLKTFVADLQSSVPTITQDVSNLKASVETQGESIQNLPDEILLNTYIEKWKLAGEPYTYYDLVFNKDTGLFGISLKTPSPDGKAEAYMLNDLTTKQAMLAVQCRNFNVFTYDCLGNHNRIALPPLGYQTGSGPRISVLQSDCCVYSSSLEVAYMAAPGTAFRAVGNYIGFTNCSKLRAVIGLGNSQGTINALSFNVCPALEYFRMYLKASMNLSGSPLLTLDTMQFLVNNALNTSAVTLTVHPDIYEKITDESNQEWHALLAAAQEKNITFATA